MRCKRCGKPLNDKNGSNISILDRFLICDKCFAKENPLKLFNQLNMLQKKIDSLECQIKKLLKK